MEKLIFESEPGIPVPAVLAIPGRRSANREAIVYVDGRGKSAAQRRAIITADLA